MLSRLVGLVSLASLPLAPRFELRLLGACLWSNFGGGLAPSLGLLLLCFGGFLLLHAFESCCNLLLHSRNFAAIPPTCPATDHSQETVSEILQDSFLLGAFILGVPLNSVLSLLEGCLHLVLAVREELGELLLIEHKLLRG